MSRHPNAGFTLIEIMAVIAILGLLFGLALPAVTRAQATGRLRACQSNLRQIAQTMQTYVDSRKKGIWPKYKGVQFLLCMAKDKELEGKALDIFRCPSTQDVTYVDDANKVPGSGFADFDNIDVNCISYAGRDNINFQLRPDDADTSVIAADDNDGRPNHKLLTNFVYMSSTVDSVDVSDFRAELGEEAEWVPVGPDSPHPELKKLLID